MKQNGIFIDFSKGTFTADDGRTISYRKAYIVLVNRSERSGMDIPEHTVTAFKVSTLNDDLYDSIADLTPGDPVTFTISLANGKVSLETIERANQYASVGE